MRTYTVVTHTGDRHSDHESFRDAADQADMIRGGVAGEHAAYKYARGYQGFLGTFTEWMAQDDDERGEYEAGAAGLPTSETR